MSAHENASHEKAGCEKTILVVDDASLVRMYYRSILEGVGFRVEEALNGLEALEKLLAAPVDMPIDMLIVDVNMPQMDGFTFLDILRKKALPLAAIPALMISTEAEQKDFAAAQLAGANFYMVKPVEPQTLIELADMMCGVTSE